MRFALHKKVRYEDVSTAQYQRAVRAYYSHLHSIDFSGARQLLKYFGDSFFHDGGVESLSLGMKAGLLKLLVYRDADREDINIIRQKLKLRRLTPKQYERNPVQYP